MFVFFLYANLIDFCWLRVPSCHEVRVMFCYHCCSMQTARFYRWCTICLTLPIELGLEVTTLLQFLCFFKDGKPVLLLCCIWFVTFQRYVTYWSVTYRNTTLDSGINIGLPLLIFGIFTRGYVLIREGNP